MASNGFPAVTKRVSPQPGAPPLAASSCRPAIKASEGTSVEIKRPMASIDERTRLLSPAAEKDASRDKILLAPPKLAQYQQQLNNRDMEEANSEGEEEDAAANDVKFLGMLFLIYCVIALGNRLFQKLMTIPMYNYPMFLNIMTTFVFVPLSFAYIWPMQKWGSSITKEQQAIPKYKFAVMGALDCLCGAMSMFAVNYISSGSMLVLIQQASIPISMALSKAFLGATYSAAQYLGAAVVCVGIVVVLSPQFSGSATTEDNGHSQVMWSGVLMLSCVPSVMSSVYKESALQVRALWRAVHTVLFAGRAVRGSRGYLRPSLPSPPTVCLPRATF